MTDEVGVKFGGDTGDLLKAIESIASRFEGLGGSAGGLISKFKEVGEAILAAFAVEKVDEFFEKLAERATDVERLSEEFEVSTKAVQDLQYAMAATGGSAGLQSLLTQLSHSLEEAIDKVGPQRQAFEDLGISMQFLKQNADNLPAVLDAVADAVKLKGGGPETVADIKELGRGMVDMLPALLQGKQGLEDLGAAAAATGGEMSSTELEGFEKIHQSLTAMSEAFSGFADMVGEEFGPAFQAIVDGVTEAISALNGGTDHVSLFRDALLALVIPIDAVVLGLESLKAGLVTMYEVATLIIDGIVELFQGLSKVMEDFRNGEFSKMASDWDATMTKMDETATKHITNIKEQYLALAKTAENMGKGVAEIADPTQDKKKKGGGGGGSHHPTSEELAAAKNAAKQEQELEQENVNFSLKMGQLQLAGKKDELDSEVALGQITNSEKIQQLLQFAQQEEALELDAVNKELQNNNLSVVQHQKLIDQKMLIEQKYKNDVAKLHQQAAAEDVKYYQQAFDAINGAFKGSLQGVLQGTQTIGQAIQNMALNVISSLAEMFAEIALKWVENKILGLVTEDETGAGIIQGHAAEAAAGAYAATAAIPYVGPALAPGAAALAFADTAAFSAFLPSFDTGSLNIPHDMVAKVHKGEIIVPAAQAEAIRNGAGGSSGSGDTHLHIHATDAQSVKRLLLNNKDAVAQAVQMAGRAFNKNVPSWKA